MKNLKIRTKLLTLVSFLLVCIIAIGVLSIAFMSKINAGSTIINENWLPSVIDAQEMAVQVATMRSQEFKHIIATDKQEQQEVESKISGIKSTVESLFSDYAVMLTNDQDKALLQSVQDGWSRYLTVHDKLLSISKENKTDEAMDVMTGESANIYDALSNTLTELVEFNKNGSNTASDNSDALYASALSITLSAILAVLLVSVLFALVLVHSITKPVREIDSVARTIADGQLDASITYQSRDELGVLAVNFNKTVTRLREYVNYINEISAVLNQIADGDLVFHLSYDYAGEFAKVKDALNHISSSLNDTMGQINQSADQVASGSDQVSSGAQALSQGATEQASSVQELAATINEISSQVKNTASNAVNASSLANETGERLGGCNQQMTEMMQAMREINDKSSEIGKIIKTIEDIAFQTNILALNAAVEAARAGAAGKGFAVVADEVRNLASKSADAAKNTTLLIEGSIKAVEQGSHIADETAQSMLAVVEKARNTVEIVDKISSAANEQADSIAQVTQGVDQISSVVQTNSATAEESAAASEELSGQAQMLKSLVSRFKLKDGGSSVPQGGAAASFDPYPAGSFEPADSSKY